MRVGDTLELVVSATDPQGEPLSYKAVKIYNMNSAWDENWQEDNVLRIPITPQDVRRDFKVVIYMRSPRQYHARGAWDDDVIFTYEVLPPMGRG